VFDKRAIKKNTHQQQGIQAV